MTHDHHTEGSAPLVYQTALPLSRTTLDLVTDLIRHHSHTIGPRWRKATPGRQAILALAWLRHDQRLTDLAAAHEVSRPRSAAGPWKSCPCSPPAHPAWTASWPGWPPAASKWCSPMAP